MHSTSAVRLCHRFDVRNWSERRTLNRPFTFLFTLRSNWVPTTSIHSTIFNKNNYTKKKMWYIKNAYKIAHTLRFDLNYVIWQVKIWLKTKFVLIKYNFLWIINKPRYFFLNFVFFFMYLTSFWFLWINLSLILIF